MIERTEKYLKLKEYTDKNCNPFELDIEKAENEKLKQALQEIKKIADYEFKELMNAEDYHNMTDVLKQILQKISDLEV